MKMISEMFQSADWKKEKHAPVIQAPRFKAGELMTVTVNVGEEIAHPNTTAHHIAWIEVYFLPRDEKFPFMLGRHSFDSHGASTQGADTSTVYTEPHFAFRFRSEKPGTIMASSYCNIHGLWSTAVELE